MFDDMWALVVEGDAHSLVAIASIMRELRIRFKRNTTGTNVIEQLRVMVPRPDFVLIDLDLPNGDAFAVAHAILSDPELHRVPLIAIGNYPASAVRTHVQRSGFIGYVPKPLPRRAFGDLLLRATAGETLWEAAV